MRAALAAVCGLAVLVLAALAAAQSPEQGSTQPPASTLAPVVTPMPEEQAFLEAKRKAEAKAKAAKARALRKQIRHKRGRTWYWLDVMQKPRKSRPFFARASQNVQRLERLNRLWKKRLQRARHQAHNPPRKWAWFCIHSHEAPTWSSSTNPKYDGGLQMDDDFQWTYGRKWRLLKGPAYNWTKWEQIWAAVQAWYSRGFGPWPNTRLECGV